MKRDSVIIIGAGLSGLECGYILAKNGMKVTVLEACHNIGGSIQSFTRKGVYFDTGFHYVGALGEGESLNRLFRYYNLMNLPWVKLDEECFDKIIIGNECFDFANGYDHFVESLSQKFPQHRTELESYVSLLKTVGDHAIDTITGESGSLAHEMFSRSAYEFLNTTITQPKLVQVLSGASQKIELRPQTLPLYPFAVMNDSFIRSAWRLQGPGSQISEALKASIENMGGEVRLGVAVTEILCHDGELKGVLTSNGEEMTADYVISSLHPSSTLALISEGANLRRSYRSRIMALENTVGAFTTYIRLKKGVVPYRNHNIYLHREGCDVWHPRAGVTDHLMIHFAVPVDGSDKAEVMDLLTFVSPQESAEWKHLRSSGHREEYERLKLQKAQECISLACQAIQNLDMAIDSIYTSTPATYEHWLGTSDGSAFGIRKDYTHPMQTLLSPKTPIANLLLTGQNLNIHGVLGVSITSFYTCAEILGMDKIINELKNN